MRRRAVYLLAMALFVAGCGGEENLTNEQVEALDEQAALAMLDCQLQKAVEDLGQEEALSRYTDELTRSIEGDGDTAQVILWNDGYRCPEYLP